VHHRVDGRVSGAHRRPAQRATPNVWYWLEVRANGGAWQRSRYPISTCCAFDATYLMNGTYYDFQLRATNLAGDSVPSNVASARPMPPYPQPPSSLVASAGDTRVSLTWNPSPTPNVYYWIEYRPAGGDWQRLTLPYTGCCTFTAQYLSNGVSYEFRVRSTNLSGDSLPSNVATAKPMPPDGFCWVVTFPPIGHPTIPRIVIPAAIGSCTGVVYSATLTVYLWNNYYGLWLADTIETTQSWGTVNNYRSGYIDSWVLMWEGGCIPHFTEARITWNDFYGRPHWSNSHSSIVSLDDFGFPC
jgi:hypothetical protein